MKAYVMNDLAEKRDCGSSIILLFKYLWLKKHVRFGNNPDQRTL